MHNERKALLRAVIDEPLEDAPRFIFADWLEEYGDGIDRLRAEFIRLQLQVETLRQCPAPGRLRGVETCSCHRCASDERQIAILSKHNLYHSGNLGGEWSRPAYTKNIAFRRGFVDSVKVTLAFWRRYDTRIITGHPITHVSISNKRPVEFREASMGPNKYAWAYEDGVEHPLPNMLPPDIMKRMSISATAAYGPSIYPGGGFVFRSEKDATNALSRVLLDMARTEVKTVKQWRRS